MLTLPPCDGRRRGNTYPRERLLHYLVSGFEILQDSYLPKQASINAFYTICTHFFTLLSSAGFMCDYWFARKSACKGTTFFLYMQKYWKVF